MCYMFLCLVCHKFLLNFLLAFVFLHLTSTPNLKLLQCINIYKPYQQNC